MQVFLFIYFLKTHKLPVPCYREITGIQTKKTCGCFKRTAHDIIADT